MLRSDGAAAVAAFRDLTNRQPYKWQERLRRRWFVEGRIPDIVDIPTGLGSTRQNAWLSTILQTAPISLRHWPRGHSTGVPEESGYWSTVTAAKWRRKFARSWRKRSEQLGLSLSSWLAPAGCMNASDRQGIHRPGDPARADRDPAGLPNCGRRRAVGGLRAEYLRPYRSGIRRASFRGPGAVRRRTGPWQLTTAV